VRLALLFCIAACGRVGFDETSPSGGGDGDGGSEQDMVSTGPKGPRWIKRFGTGGKSQVAGVRGEVAVVAPFTGGSFAADDNVALSGQAFISSAYVRYSATGEVMQTAALDASGFCDMRGITLDGEDVIVAGYTQGTTAVAAYGACSIVTTRQDPIVLRLAPDGTQSVVAHWTATTSNAQAWNVRRLTDGTFITSGIYGGGMTIGSALPTATIDPSGWLGRTSPASPTGGAAWGEGMTGTATIFGGPLATSGDVTCTLGAYNGTPTILGTPLPNAGGTDLWVASFDADETPIYVRSIGSTAIEPDYGAGSVAARTDATCTVGTLAREDVTLDAVVYPGTDGPGIVVRYNADSSVKWATRVPGEPFVAYVGDRLFVAVEVTGTLSIGETQYAAQSKDTVVLELDDTGAIVALAGAVGGAGDQRPAELVAIGPDALAITVLTQGELSFGGTTFDTLGTTMRAVGSLGI
jgi:hypothetical protein